MRPIKGLAILLVSFALGVLPGCGPKNQVQWEKYGPEKLAEASLAGKPVILYFYAAWCQPCHALKEKTFSDPEVIQALEPYARIKVDMSFNKSDKIKKIASQFRIEAYPSILFYNPEGNEVNSLRQQGFIPPQRVLQVTRNMRQNFDIPVTAPAVT